MESDDDTVQQTRDIAVVVTGPGLVLPNVIKTIEECVYIGKFEITRSGSQLIARIRIPVGVEFSSLLAQLALDLGGAVGGIMPGSVPLGTIRIDLPANRSAIARTRDRLKSGLGSKDDSRDANARSVQDVSASPAALTNLSAVEAAPSTPPVLQSITDTTTGQPNSRLVDSPITIALVRVFGGIRFGVLAIATGLAVVLEPFTADASEDDANDAN